MPNNGARGRKPQRVGRGTGSRKSHDNVTATRLGRRANFTDRPYDGMHEPFVSPEDDHFEAFGQFEDSCSYCGQQTSDFLVKCVEKNCQRWFCNGCKNNEPGGGQTESHIITHLRISHHRQIAVLDKSRVSPKTGEVAAIPSRTFPLFRFRCIACSEDDLPDAFDLGMEGMKDGRNPKKHFCRQHGIQLEKFSTIGKWVPFVDCHHPPFKCFNQSIVKVPSKVQQRHCDSVSRQDIVDIERSWLLAANGLVMRDNGASTETIWEDFSTTSQYKEHFLKLVQLECQMDQADCLSIPVLENVIILRRDTDFPIKWFEFETKSKVHMRALQKGQSITINVDRNNHILTVSASVLTHDELHGVATICVSFSERNTRASDLEGATIGIEVDFQDSSYRRRMAALQRFAGDGDAVKDKRITAFILGSPIKKQFQHGKHSKYGKSPGKVIINQPEQQQLERVPGQELNDSQESAVRMALTSPLSLIQGPPGTGKTHTIVALVYNLLHRSNSKAQILCCAPSNDPADHLAVQMALAFRGTDFQVTRIHSQRIQTRNLHENVRNLSLRYKLEQLLGRDFEHNADYHPKDIDYATDEIIRKSHVICTTCNTAADVAISDRIFPFIIIDEATQATEADAMIPITKGCEKLVLIGDEKQLGVVSKFRELENSNQVWSLFERLIQLGQAPCVMLDTQYRMHPVICEPPSTVIYEGLLKTGLEVAALRKSTILEFIHPTPLRSGQILIIDTGSNHRGKFHELAPNGSSWLNGHEAVVVSLCLVNLIHRQKVKPEDIGVITFYNGQKDHLKKNLHNHDCIADSFYKKVMIDSVDAFQGREKDFIILSCVRSGHVKSTTVGFLADQRRLNVALTRAKKGVIIVGNRTLLEKSQCWKEILVFYPTISEQAALLALGVPFGAKRLACLYCYNPHQRVHMPFQSQTFHNSFMRHGLSNITASTMAQKAMLVAEINVAGTSRSADKARPVKPDMQVNAKAVEVKKQNGKDESAVVVLPVNVPSPSNLDDLFGVETSPDILVEYTTRWTDEKLYCALTKYLLKISQLKGKGYPFSYCRNDNISDQNGFVYFKAKSSKITDKSISGNLRECERCRKKFNVDSEGSYSVEEECQYHSGKRVYLETVAKRSGKQKQKMPNIKNFTYSCCAGNPNSSGCDTARGHVSRSYSTMFDFIPTQQVRPRTITGQIVRHSKHPEIWKSVLAMDCEMLYTTAGYELGRITLVNRKLESVYDCFVLPGARVVDYNTRYSGLTEEHFSGEVFRGVPVKTLATVQKNLLGPIIHAETLLIGHSLEADLLCLKMVHNCVIDTSVVFRAGGRKAYTPALRTLSSDLLKKVIQSGSDGHNSFEDAAACMELMLWQLGKEHSALELPQT